VSTFYAIGIEAVLGLGRRRSWGLSLGKRSKTNLAPGKNTPTSQKNGLKTFLKKKAGRFHEGEVKNGANGSSGMLRT
jgi:hypothetical protein